MIKSTSKFGESSGNTFDSWLYIAAIGTLLLSGTLYLLFIKQGTFWLLFPVCALALISGVFFESKQLTDKWSNVLRCAGDAFALSLIALIPLRSEDHYVLENRIGIWSYLFIFFYVVAAVSFHNDRERPKLTEGITLLQSVAFIYWVVEFSLVSIDQPLIILMTVAGLMLTVYTLFHAFSHSRLSSAHRLTLSLWNSVIMILFGIESIYRVCNQVQIDETAGMSSGIYLIFQFFLAGVSGIFIVQNLLMLLDFLPGKGTFFNKQYRDDVVALKNEHIERYSDQQVNVVHSLICVFFAGAVFIFNHYYQILPRHLAIWIVFVIYPFLLHTYNYARQRNVSVG